MTRKRTLPTDAAELRRRAEAKLRERKKTAPLAPATEADSLRLIHELQVHQIELEMQNEELVQTRAALETALSQYTDLFDFAPIGYFMLARDGTIEQANLAGAGLLGVERSKIVQRRFGLFVSAEWRSTFNTFLDEVFRSRESLTCEVALQRDGVDPQWAHIEARLADDSTGPSQMCRAAIVDISAARQAEDALRQSEEHFRNLAQALPDAIYTLNLPSEQVTYFNHDAFLDYPCSELMADISLLSARHPDETPTFSSNWQRIISGEALAPLEYRVLNKSGVWEWVQRRTVALAHDAHGRPTQLLIILSQISERKHTTEALRHLSTHDALTGLYNRGFFEAELARLERGRRFPISLVMADVDRLKETNDRFGHAAGDALLQRVAQVLTAAFRSEDLVTRIGGDEFAVLLPGTNAAAAESSLRRVREVIQENNADQPEAPIRLALGVSTANSPRPLAGALREADEAMYRDKRGYDAS